MPLPLFMHAHSLSPVAHAMGVRPTLRRPCSCPGCIVGYPWLAGMEGTLVNAEAQRKGKGDLLPCHSGMQSTLV